MVLYKQKMQQYAPGADPNIPYHAFGWAVANSFHKAMEAAKCPTREGLRDAVRNLQNVKIDMLLPGVTMNTAQGDGFPIESMQLMTFKGERWELFGDVIDTRKEFGPLTG